MSQADPEAAIQALRDQCAGAPGAAAPRIALARALLAARRAAEAVVPAEQACALQPGSSEALAIRAAVVDAIEAGDQDLVALELASALAPSDALAQLTLGDAYANLERPHDAERCYKAALALGRTHDANAALGALYLSVRMLDAAEHHARAALAGEEVGADATLQVMARQTLAGVCDAKGDFAGAARHLDEAYGRQSLFRQPGANAAFTTLVLVTRTQGNVPYQSLLPPLKFDRCVWYMEHARIEQVAELPPYAVVLNAIGDADAALASRPMVDSFLERCARPVLNHPDKVAATSRHRLAEILDGIPGVVTPLTVRLTTETIARDGLAEAAKAAGLTPPVLVRPAGSHGGVGLVLAEDVAALSAKPVPVGADIYVTRFHDTRGADGFWRKHRMIFVGRRAFPYHLAISPHWMVHHQSSGMEGDPARQAEELAFLRNPAAALGAGALAAVEAIGRRLDLDYAGLDFTLDAEGQVVVFEANATMLTHLEPEDGLFAAKNPFIQPIIEAFQTHITALART